ncbi:MAG: exosortase A [Pseudomonadota bacterium]|nr:exosortase A [Pseudomonadota bacterium]
MQPDAPVNDAAAASSQEFGLIAAIPEQWRKPLAVLAAVFAVLGVVTAREWGEMFHQWWNIDTYNHILLVPLIAVWLVWLKADECVRVTPRSWGWGLALIGCGLLLWSVGRISGINLLAHAGAVGVMQAAIVTVLGVRASVLLALPIAYLTFLVPFGDEIIPMLQAITAEIAIALTHWSGIPAVIDGIFIDTPVGLFIVAEACSGVKFLVAMITLSVLVGFTRFKSWNRRAIFFAASVVVPIIANGIRAWGTIYIAQFAGVEFAAGFDHIFYGWIFFALVVILVLAGAWRFFEMEPDEYGFTPEELGEMTILQRFEAKEESLLVILAAVVALAIVAAVVVAILSPAAV